MCPARRTASRGFRLPISARSRLAASDYLRLAHDYHTILIDRIPVMDYAERNAAKRFIALIDTLYDNAVKLMASAEADPLSLYLRDRRQRGQRVQADRLAADRDELGILSGAAARPQGFRGQRVEHGAGGDVEPIAVIPGATKSRTRNIQTRGCDSGCAARAPE